VTASRKEQLYVAVLLQFFDFNTTPANFVALQAVEIANRDNPFCNYLFHKITSFNDEGSTRAKGKRTGKPGTSPLLDLFQCLNGRSDYGRHEAPDGLGTQFGGLG